MITKSPSRFDGKKTGCSQGVWNPSDLKRHKEESEANLPPSHFHRDNGKRRHGSRSQANRDRWVNRAYKALRKNPEMSDAELFELLGIRPDMPRIQRAVAQRLQKWRSEKRPSTDQGTQAKPRVDWWSIAKDYLREHPSATYWQVMHAIGFTFSPDSEPAKFLRSMIQNRRFDPV